VVREDFAGFTQAWKMGKSQASREQRLILGSNSALGGSWGFGGSKRSPYVHRTMDEVGLGVGEKEDRALQTWTGAGTDLSQHGQWLWNLVVPFCR
jgi:hypothetical protein